MDSIRELVKCEEELVLLKAGLEMTHPAPAAVAVPEALELLKLYRKLCGSDYARHHSTHLKRIDNAIAALAVTPAAAAPVALPETESAIRQVMNLVSDWGIADFMAAEARLDAASSDANQKELDEAEKRIKAAQVARRAIETKLRALLAGGSTPAAQAVEPTDAELIALNAGECYFGESPSKYPELGHGTQYHAGAPGVLGFARAALALRSDPAAYSQKFQQRVQPWMMACFGPEISADRIERNHRFLEESLELVQSCGCTASEAHQLVDYVFGRPVGEPAQETGGVMVTLAALCLASGLDMHACGETELARIWTKVEAIRTKQAAKPKHSPLPMHVPQAQADARDANQVIGDLAYALDMLVGANASHSLCEQEPMDAMGRVKGTWSKAAECNAQSTLEIHRAAIAAAKGEDQ
ncbi:hypothetical protein [Comamonas testosteroni]|uniref:hypothetical protein n=1 Tax=Comamonas testosteroni TaxID=285 RepID=UPI00391B977A